MKYDIKSCGYGCVWDITVWARLDDFGRNGHRRILGALALKGLNQASTDRHNDIFKNPESKIFDIWTDFLLKRELNMTDIFSG